MPDTEYWNPYVGDDCAEGAPFGGQPNCGYDLAGNYLNFLLPDFTYDKELEYNGPGTFYAFDQSPFMTEGSKIFDHGFIYVPDGCGDGEECDSHIFFHGCG